MPGFGFVSRNELSRLYRQLSGHLTDYSTLCPGTAGGFQSTFRFVVLILHPRRRRRSVCACTEEEADAHQPRHSATVGNTHATEQEEESDRER